MSSTPLLPGMRVALVHDWLTGMRGGEKCLEVLCEMLPTAPVHTLLHVRGSVSPTIERHEIRTSFIQSLPLAASQYRSYLPLFPLAIEQFDLSQFDLVVSTSHCVAKGARRAEHATHICYCHTPMRYVWDQYEEYFGKGRAGWVTRAAMRAFAPGLRRWDVRTSGRVDRYIANSQNVRGRIERIYGRSADVVFPPVDVDRFVPGRPGGSYALVVSALVPYKRVDLAIDACSRLQTPLFIVGKGPERARLERMAGDGVTFLGWQDDEHLAELYAGCSELLFPGEEDFGIVPLEAMACGKPVVAYAKGGALETVVDGQTGVFFTEQTADGLTEAIVRCRSLKLDPAVARAQALQFSRARYRERMESVLMQEAASH